MNLYIRMLIALMRSLFTPRIKLLDECLTPFRVWPTDHDAFGHMTNSKFFALTDIGIMDYMSRAGYLTKLMRRGWLPIVVYEDMVMKKPLRFPQRFTVSTCLAGWTETHAVIAHVFRRGETFCAEGYTIARFVSTKGEKISTTEVLKFLGEPTHSPILDGRALDVLARASEGYNLDGPEREKGGVRVAA